MGETSSLSDEFRLRAALQSRRA